MEELGTPGGAEDTWGSWGPPGELAPPGSLGIIWGPLWPGGHARWSPVPRPTQGTLPLPARFPPKQSKHPEHRGWKQVPGPGGPGGGRGTPPHHLPHRCGAQPAATSAQVGLGVPRATAEGPPITPTPPQAAFFLLQSLPPLPALRAAAVPTQHRGAGSQGVLLGGPGRGGTGACPFKGGGCHAESPFLCWRGGQAPRGHGTGRGTARRGEGWSQLQTEPRQLSARGADRVRHHG